MVLSWFASKVSPIAVDIGTETIKLLQVEPRDGSHRLVAAASEAVEKHMNLLSRQKLEVVGIHVEPNALIECFSHLNRRKGDENISTMYIDMGAGATHVVIAHGKQLVFAKHLAVGGDTLN